MEDALVLDDGTVYLAANYTVLILVLMEDALVPKTVIIVLCRFYMS